jgi:hypothetical protein
MYLSIENTYIYREHILPGTGVPLSARSTLEGRVGGSPSKPHFIGVFFVNPLGTYIYICMYVRMYTHTHTHTHIHTYLHIYIYMYVYIYIYMYIYTYIYI